MEDAIERGDVDAATELLCEDMQDDELFDTQDFKEQTERYFKGDPTELTVGERVTSSRYEGTIRIDGGVKQVDEGVEYRKENGGWCVMLVG